MNNKSVFCALLLFTLLPYQSKAQATPPTLGSAVKLTKEKLKVSKPGAFNLGVQSGYTAILRAPADRNNDYPSILGTIRFSTIKTKLNPQGSGNVNISCGGSMLSGPCSSAIRNVANIEVKYNATNFNYTAMRTTGLKLINADPNALLPSHWVYSISGQFIVRMIGDTGSTVSASYIVNCFTQWGEGLLSSYYNSARIQPFQYITKTPPNDMSVFIKKS
jgi:hypothetical protein